MADFTFIDWILMIPKLAVLMTGEMHGRSHQADASAACSGYHHSWYDMKGLDPVALANFPSDLEISEIINAAHQEASSLLSILGIQNSYSHIPDKINDWINEASQADTAVPSDVKLSALSITNQLHDLITADNVDYEMNSRPSDVDNRTLSLSIIAAATLTHNTIQMHVFVCLCDIVL
jgi:hypothetical protein